LWQIWSLNKQLPRAQEKKPNQGPTFKSKIVTKCQIKGKELDTTEFDQIVNVVEEDINENKTKNSVDFFETILTAVEYKSNEHLVEIWYLDSSVIKHMLGNNFNFKVLENFVKIQNVKSAGSHIHYVHGKEKSILLMLLGK
jgi:hypothetical protein